jgi:hypothetical protein
LEDVSIIVPPRGPPAYKSDTKSSTKSETGSETGSETEYNHLPSQNAAPRPAQEPRPIAPIVHTQIHGSFLVPRPQAMSPIMAPTPLSTPVFPEQ